MSSNANKETEITGEPSNTSEALYRTFVSVRNTELTTYWSRYSVQSAINFGLLAVALASKSDSRIGAHIVFIASIGIVLAVIWLLYVTKGKQILVDRWEMHIRLYEKSTPKVKYKLFSKIKKEEDSKRTMLRIWDNLTILSCIPPILCVGAWIVIAFKII